MESTFLKRLVLMAAALLCVHSAGNWILPLIDRDEPRFAEASREMEQRGDWLVPFFNGQPRYDKPPLIYWLQCASFRTLGMHEFSARFPSVLCAVATALLVSIWGLRAISSEAGLRAGWIFGLSLQVAIHARAAVADMALILCMTVSAWAGWEVIRGAGVGCWRRWWIVLWFGLAGGFLAKGPIAMVPLGMVVIGLWKGPWAPRWTAWLVGCAGWLILVGAWGVPALIATQGEFASVGLGKHVVARSILPLEGHGAKSWLGYVATLPMYFISVFASFFPWSIWLVAMVRSGRHSAGEELLRRYLWVGVWLVFGIFTLSRTKLPHYTLPAFPMLALLLAAWWERARSPETFRRTVVWTGSALFAVTLGGSALMRAWFPAETLFQRAKPLLRPEMELASVEYHEPGLVWTFRRVIEGFHTPLKASKAERWLSQPGPRLLVLPSGKLDELFPKMPEGVERFDAEGLWFTKGRVVKLTLLVKVE
jgi:4-amino-4-deoxy-L-arabinose transferase-like glycosyltransferase